MYVVYCSVFLYFDAFICKRPFHGFFQLLLDIDELGKIRRYHRKERLKISKIAKFESDLLKTNKDIAPEGGGGALNKTLVRGVPQRPSNPKTPHAHFNSKWTDCKL